MLEVRPQLSITEFPIPREVILTVEQLLKNAVAEDASVSAVDLIPIQHDFIPGAYSRSMRVPAGVLLVGKIHRKPCFNFILSGRCVVWDERGRKDITAPLFFISPPGTKRIIYVVDDLIWHNVHGTNETELDKVEAELIAPTYSDLKDSLQWLS